MKTIIGAAFGLLFFTGCASSKIYVDDQVTCTWTEVEELIICKEAP